MHSTGLPALLLEALSKEGLTKRALSDAVKANPRTLANVLSVLKAEGLLERVQYFQLTTAGRKRLVELQVARLQRRCDRYRERLLYAPETSPQSPCKGPEPLQCGEANGSNGEPARFPEG